MEKDVQNERNRNLRLVLLALGTVEAIVVIALLAKPFYSRAFSSPAGNASPSAAAADAQGDPWTAAETVAPADLVKELADPEPAKRPLVACVGFKFLYDGGHVPGASFHGPASKDEGLAELKKWAQGLPKSSNVVLYCGCCPMVRCPNLRPAFAALHDVGFARLRVLLLPTNFATDWAGKGYPIEKSSQ